MSSELYLKNESTHIVLKEVFGEDINIGDTVLMDPIDDKFLYLCPEAYRKAPIFMIQEDDLCWYDKETDTYITVYNDLDMTLTLYVYKVNIGEAEKQLLSLSSDFCDYFRTNNLEKIFCIPYRDILARKPESGDLLLVFYDDDLRHSSYTIYINDNLLYGDHYIIDGVTPYFYIITKPSDRELEIKSRLTRKYNRVMQLESTFKRNGLGRGDYFFGSSHYYIYLGDTDKVKGISLYLKITYCSSILTNKLINVLEKDGLNYANLLNYVSSDEKYYIIALEKKHNATLKYGGHIDIGISNEEICSIFSLVYDDILDKNSCNTNKCYNSLEELKVDYMRLLAQLRANLNKQIIKLIQEFNGDYNYYKKLIESYTNCDALNMWYTSLQLFNF